jgi:hypothetical protein
MLKNSKMELKQKFATDSSRPVFGNRMPCSRATKRAGWKSAWTCGLSHNFSMSALAPLKKWILRCAQHLLATITPMPRFYEPDLGAHPDSPFARDASNKLVRRSYWLDMNDRTLVMVMVNGIGAHLTNDERRAHLIDLKRDHLIDQVCVQEILPPEEK